MIKQRKQWILVVLAVACVIALVSCGGISANHPDLVRAEKTYQKVASEPWVKENAPVEMHEASQALQAARQAENTEDLKHLTYLAERHAQIALEAASKRKAEKEIKELAEVKDAVLLEARDTEILLKDRKIRKEEKEAAQARLEAARAKEEAELKAREAAQARAQAETARELAEQMKEEIGKLNVKETDRGLVLTLGDVLFEFDKAELMPGAVRTVDKVVAFLEQYKTRDILIEGHTDSIGTAAYNQELSQRRAEALRDALIKRGIASNRIVAKGYGESYPVASNETEAGRQQNRRVEIVILKGKIQ
jgi:outer membrane protein OmpA-like peptidoglycan-associated protein